MLNVHNPTLRCRQEITGIVVTSIFRGHLFLVEMQIERTLDQIDAASYFLPTSLFSVLHIRRYHLLLAEKKCAVLLVF